MPDFQHVLFRWAESQPLANGAIFLIIGILCGFHGFRVFTLILAASTGFVGWLVGAIAAGMAQVSTFAGGAVGAVLLAILALRKPKPAIAINCALTYGLLGIYLTHQLGISRDLSWALAGAATLAGLVFALLNTDTMAVVLTTLQGSVLIVLGFVSVSNAAFPSVGNTFVDWSSSQGLVVPIFLGMIVTAAYAYQSSQKQGDIRAGETDKS